MIIEQVRIDSILEQVLNKLKSFISITKSCPAVDSLCHSPSGTHVRTVLHGNLCCCKPFCIVLCDEISRIKSEQVRHMTVIISLTNFISICILVKCCLCIPFLDLSAITNFNWSFQICLVCFPCGYQIGIFSKYLCSFDRIFI